MAACGIAPEDDDGNSASRKPEPKKSGMSESAIADHLAAIASATTGLELKSAWEAADKAAEQAGDQEASNQFIEAVEKKKAKKVSQSNASQA